MLIPKIYLAKISELQDLSHELLAGDKAINDALLNMSDRRQESFKAGRALLKMALVDNGFLTTNDNLPPLLYGEQGKPYFDSLYPNLKNKIWPCFNIAHSGDNIVLTIGASEQGIDIEKVRVRKISTELSQRVLNVKELEFYNRLLRGELYEASRSEGVEAEGVKAEGLNAKGIKAEGWNAKGVKASGALCASYEKMQALVEDEHDSGEGNALSYESLARLFFTRQWSIKECLAKVSGSSIFDNLSALNLDPFNSSIVAPLLPQGVVLSYALKNDLFARISFDEYLCKNADFNDISTTLLEGLGAGACIFPNDFFDENLHTNYQETIAEKAFKSAIIRTIGTLGAILKEWHFKENAKDEVTHLDRLKMCNILECSKSSLDSTLCSYALYNQEYAILYRYFCAENDEKYGFWHCFVQNIKTNDGDKTIKKYSIVSSINECDLKDMTFLSVFIPLESILKKAHHLPADTSTISIYGKSCPKIQENALDITSSLDDFKVHFKKLVEHNESCHDLCRVRDLVKPNVSKTTVGFTKSTPLVTDISPLLIKKNIKAVGLSCSPATLALNAVKFFLGLDALKALIAKQLFVGENISEVRLDSGLGLVNPELYCKYLIDQTNIQVHSDNKRIEALRILGLIPCSLFTVNF